MMNQIVVRLLSQQLKGESWKSASIVDAETDEPSGILKRVFAGMITLSRHSREDSFFYYE